MSVPIASVVYHSMVYYWSVGRCVDWSMMVVMLGPVRPVRPIRSVATVVVASQGNPSKYFCSLSPYKIHVLIISIRMTK